MGHFISYFKRKHIKIEFGAMQFSSWYQNRFSNKTFFPLALKRGIQLFSQWPWKVVWNFFPNGPEKGYKTFFPMALKRDIKLFSQWPWKGLCKVHDYLILQEMTSAMFNALFYVTGTLLKSHTLLIHVKRRYHLSFFVLCCTFAALAAFFHLYDRI